MPMPSPNMLYFGDNLSILREHISDESVHLIYLDPPFQLPSNLQCAVCGKKRGEIRAQITAIEDTWHWGEESEHAFWDVVSHGAPKIAKFLSTLREFLGNNDLMAYLTMMTVRLIELHRVLKPTGSIYLHCDPTASHYLKLPLDAIFGQRNFRNEIIWKRTSAHSDSHRYARVHDILLFYSKGNNFIWNSLRVQASEDYFKSHDFMRDDDGQLFRGGDATAPGGRGPRFLYRTLFFC